MPPEAMLLTEHHAQQMVQEVLELLGNAIPHSGSSQSGCLHSQQRQLFLSWGIHELPFSSCQPLAHRTCALVPSKALACHLIPPEILLLDEHTPREFYFHSC